MISLLLTVAGIVLIFVARTIVAGMNNAPTLGDIFSVLTAAGALWAILRYRRSLTARDWMIAAGTGLLVGLTMPFTSLFNPYPFLNRVDGAAIQGVIRGTISAVAMLGGLAILHQGGPVLVRLTRPEPRQLLISLLIGLGIGLPLAVINVFALQFTQGQPVNWQNPLAAMLDALQPALVEEVVFRFAMLGLIWLILRGSLPAQAGWLAGLLTLLTHNFMHFNDLFFEAPLVALGMGLVMSILWGLPLTILALRRDLESAVAFHWLQDVLRFVAGY